MLCNCGQTREQKIAYLCGICKPMQPSATADRTLVAGAGQRFESARRLSLLPIDKPNTRNAEVLGDLPGASLHHRYITEVWVRLAHKLMPRNVSRNAWETLSGTS